MGALGSNKYHMVFALGTFSADSSGMEVSRPSVSTTGRSTDTAHVYIV